MGLDDVTEKASDTGIEKAGDTAEKKAGGHGDKVDKAEQAADDKIGS
ncbi:Rv0909 family putative TA system antitoxin [Cellulomonas sp. Marseille-Q8402]